MVVDGQLTWQAFVAIGLSLLTFVGCMFLSGRSEAGLAESLVGSSLVAAVVGLVACGLLLWIPWPFTLTLAVLLVVGYGAWWVGGTNGEDNNEPSR